jgi:hypothetical protein
MREQIQIATRAKMLELFTDPARRYQFFEEHIGPHFVDYHLNGGTVRDGDVRRIVDEEIDAVVAFIRSRQQQRGAQQA